MTKEYKSRHQGLLPSFVVLLLDFTCPRLMGKTSSCVWRVLSPTQLGKGSTGAVVDLVWIKGCCFVVLNTHMGKHGRSGVIVRGEFCSEECVLRAVSEVARVSGEWMEYDWLSSMHNQDSDGFWECVTEHLNSWHVMMSAVLMRDGSGDDELTKLRTQGGTVRV
jgi:hypothetical protein